MTRQEFIDEVTTWSELIDFCNNEGCDYCDSIYDESTKDESYDEAIVDMARSANGWQDLYNTLEDIPTGYEYYIRDDYGEFRGADDDDFDQYKRDVLEWMDDEDNWEEEDEDDDEEPAPVEYSDPEDEIPVEDESISVADLFTTCNSALQKIDSEEDEDKDAFNDFCAEVGVTVTVKIKGGNA